MQTQSIRQLDEAVSEVFALMLNRECNPGQCPGPPSAGQDDELRAVPSAKDGISAVISFSGSMRGTCSIQLALHSAAAITGELLGEDAGDTGALTADAAGELCNMIAGSWKSRQTTPAGACALSSPLVSSLVLPPPPEPQCGPSHGSVSFRHVLVRVYRFEDHCLRLELGFD